MALVSRWKLNEQSGTTIADSVGSNDGTWVGTELVTNGDFSADSDWVKETGWTIPTPTADRAGPQAGSSNINQAIGVEAGKSYTVQYTYTRTAGTVKANIGGADGSVNSNAGPETITEVIIAGSGNTLLKIIGDAPFDGTIDNVSVRETVVPRFSSLGTGLLFDGVDDKITVPADSSIDANGKTEFTITALINPASDGEINAGRIVDKRNLSGIGYHFFVNQEAGGLVGIRCSVAADTTDMEAETAPVISIDILSHVAFTYNEDGNRKGKLYVNGILQTLTTDIAADGSITDDSAINLIIGNAENGTRAFDGVLADVRFYNTALSDSDIKQIVKEGTIRKVRDRYDGSGLPKDRIINR